jgi:hypothetical protein
MHFAEETDSRRQAAVTAALGGGITLAEAALNQAAQDNQDEACPTITTEADGDHIVGGCTTSGEDAYEGEAIVVNLDRSDTAAPVEMTFLGFDNDLQSFDGTASAGPYTAEGLVNEADLTARVFAITMGFRGTITCLTECTPSEDAEGWTNGGGFTIDGAWGSSAGTSGWMELTGRDGLRVDFDAGSGNCWPITIDGDDAGELCL